MWDEVRTVFWMEYRRHLRSRLFWRMLLLIAGSSMMIAGGAGFLLSFIGDADTFGTLIGSVSIGLMTALGAVAIFAPPVIVPRIFSDVYKTRAVPDIYLTALHPLAIVAGRTLTAGAQVGLILLTLFPAGILVCQIAGFVPTYWLFMAGLTWIAMLTLVGLSVVLMNKRFPADAEGALAGTPALTAGGVSLLLLVSLFVLFQGWLAGSRGHLPLYLMSPLLIPYEMYATVSLGSWELPVWVLAVPMMIGLCLLAMIVSAQWLGWWSDTAYQFQRWGGTAFFLTVYALHMGIYAQSGVHSITEAERAVFWGMILGGLAYAFACARMLGYYGIGARPRPLRHALPYPLGGVMWGWALVLAIALIAWLTVGWASGYWVDPRRWLMWSLCLIGLLLLAQSLNTGILIFYWHSYRSAPVKYVRAEARAIMEMYGSQMPASLTRTLFLWLVIVYILHLIPLKLTQIVGSWLMLINPMYALSNPDRSLSFYAGYALYMVVLTAFMTMIGVRQARIWLNHYQSRQVESESSQ